jgi:hypothetical protein
MWIVEQSIAMNNALYNAQKLSLQIVQCLNNAQNLTNIAEQNCLNINEAAKRVQELQRQNYSYQERQQQELAENIKHDIEKMATMAQNLTNSNGSISCAVQACSQASAYQYEALQVEKNALMQRQLLINEITADVNECADEDKDWQLQNLMATAEAAAAQIENYARSAQSTISTINIVAQSAVAWANMSAQNIAILQDIHNACQ